MIQFFRHIRQTLVMENKTSKYFKYAIGEIVLVVIGILIALQINNWNETRKDHKKEKVILNQIHLDFLSNKVQLDSIKASNEKALASCGMISSLFPIERKESSFDSIGKYLSDIFQVKTFNPTNGSIEALISSSTFDVIQNDSLRNFLVSWKDVYDDYREEEQYARDFQLWEASPFMRKNINRNDLYSKENLDLMVSNEFQNIIQDKCGSYQEILDAIKDEQLEHYIVEILRLTNQENR